MAHEFHKPNNVYRTTKAFCEEAPRIQGYDFNKGVDHHALLQSFYNTGFQATHFSRAVQEINRMVRKLEPPAIGGQILTPLLTDREAQATVEGSGWERHGETSALLPLPEELHHLPGLHLQHDQ